MGLHVWREVLRETEVAHGLPDLFDNLELNGWPARGRVGSHGVRFWPDGGRGRQIVIDIRYPVNEHKLEEYREHTGLPIEITINEGGK